MSISKTLQTYALAFRDHGLDAVFNGLLPLLTIAGVLWLVLRLFTPKEVAATGFMFALVGALVGLMMGSSREPVVQAIVPALVTLIAGYMAWTVRQDAHDTATPGADPGAATVAALADAADVKKENGEKKKGEGKRKGEPPIRFSTVTVLASVSALMIATATGSMWGSSMRLRKDDFDRRYEEWRLMYERKQLPVETDILRRKAGLPLSGAKAPAAESAPDANE